MTTQSDLDAAMSAATKEASAQSQAAASIASGVQTSKEVVAEFDYYAKFYPKKFPKTIEQGAAWATSSLKQYAKDNAKAWTAEAIDKVASAYGYEGYVPSEIPTNEKEAAAALVNIACVAAAEELGIDPRIAKVTVEAVIDGKLDKHDAEAIGSLAGSIAGAALCQTFGIPAPIGAFLGGELGGLIGGEIADIFGASRRAHEEWLRKQGEIVRQIHYKATQQCQVVREGYWKTFDTYVAQAVHRWEDMEMHAGALFDLRWFGRTPSYAFMQFVQQQTSRYGNRIGQQSCDVVCLDGSILKTTAAPYMTTLLNRPDEYKALAAQCGRNIQAALARRGVKVPATHIPPVDSCGLDCITDYGCLYPDMTPYTKYPNVPGALSSAARVCSAYYAVGFPWLPPQPYAEVPPEVAAKMGPYRNIGCSLPEATRKDVENIKQRQLWINWLNTLVESEYKRIDALNSASVRIFGDLAQTAAMVAVQKKISDSKTRASLMGLGATDPAITRATSWVNNGALVAGLGWLAYNSGRR